MEEKQENKTLSKPNNKHGEKGRCLQSLPALEQGDIGETHTDGTESDRKLLGRHMQKYRHWGLKPLSFFKIIQKCQAKGKHCKCTFVRRFVNLMLNFALNLYYVI